MLIWLALTGAYELALPRGGEAIVNLTIENQTDTALKEPINASLIVEPQIKCWIRSGDYAVRGSPGMDNPFFLIPVLGFRVSDKPLSLWLGGAYFRNVYYDEETYGLFIWFPWRLRGDLSSWSCASCQCLASPWSGGCSSSLKPTHISPIFHFTKKQGDFIPDPNDTLIVYWSAYTIGFGISGNWDLWRYSIPADSTGLVVWLTTIGFEFGYIGELVHFGADSFPNWERQHLIVTGLYLRFPLVGEQGGF